MDGWNTIVSFWGPAYFQVRTVSFRGCIENLYPHFFLAMFDSVFFSSKLVSLLLESNGVYPRPFYLWKFGRVGWLLKLPIIKMPFLGVGWKWLEVTLPKTNRTSPLKIGAPKTRKFTFQASIKMGLLLVVSGRICPRV